MLNYDLFKAGFVPGEGIHFKASIHNNTNIELKALKISLIKRLCIQAQTNSKQYDKTVALLKNEYISPEKSELVWESEVFIPPVCPSSNISSKMISLSYLLMFNVVTSKLSDSIELEIPITIGSKPFKVRNGRFLHTYEPFQFEYPKLNTIPVLEGEINSNNLNKYKPLYPFFKYI